MVQVFNVITFIAPTLTLISRVETGVDLIEFNKVSITFLASKLYLRSPCMNGHGTFSNFRFFLFTNTVLPLNVTLMLVV